MKRSIPDQNTSHPTLFVTLCFLQTLLFHAVFLLTIAAFESRALLQFVISRTRHALKSLGLAPLPSHTRFLPRIVTRNGVYE